LVFAGISLLIIIPFTLCKYVLFKGNKSESLIQKSIILKSEISNSTARNIPSKSKTLATSASAPENTQHSNTGILPGDLNGVKPLPFTVQAGQTTQTNEGLSTLSPQSTPTPESPVDIEEVMQGEDTTPYFHLVSGKNPPEWWVAPVLSIIHNDAGVGRLYFNMKLENLESYKNIYSAYSYRIECISYPQLNKRQCITPYGLPGEINDINLWQYFGNQWLGLMPLYDLCVKANGFLYALPMKYYTTFEDEINLMLMPGMVVKYRFIFQAEGFEQIYEKSVTLHNVGTGDR
jgi:hypothetical protein